MEMINAGHLMSLAALQRQDPYINQLLDVTGQVALYNFNSKANEWEKTEIEGTLFVYSRSASPHHGFTIMNRLSTENLVEPINKDLEFQLQDPFLLYRNGNLGIYSIWFYDKRDCQRIAQLMVKIVKQEADHAQRKTPESGRTNGVAEPRSIDIMELLSKAKEDYQRGMARETRVSTEASVKTVSDVTQRAQNTQPPESAHTGVKQITVEELFGSSLPKDPPVMTKPAQVTAASNHFPSAYIQKQTFPSAAHQSAFVTSQFSAQDPVSSQQQVPVLIPSPFVMNPSPVFQSVVSRPEPKSQCAVSPLMMPSADTEILTAPPGSTSSPAAPTSFLGQEMVTTLKPAASSVSSGIHKPILAPSFLPSTLVPPHSFQEPKMDVFSQLPTMIKPIPAVPMSPGLAVPGSGISVLLSPSAFQQTVNKPVTAPVAPSAPPEPPAASGRAAESPSGPCSKAQLQETLIHLIKNDPDFLSVIHDAYLQSLSKDLGNVKL
ncbi:mRNA-decapping enzyme 1A [Austrofundulus limnaeus]|uniref:5'-(N(7)-methylguanosine 5'-triphospho)-[mRNA] hydrolase n=1 Tax=Austrofundulus limnaeus TaxID=52670 RepID=A0A2I4ANT4_AUSLI|nr:PREDICTED: mRNA-decapping enzyme 1A [Austrofundulus limnaeus]